MQYMSTPARSAKDGLPNMSCDISPISNDYHKEINSSPEFFDISQKNLNISTKFSGESIIAFEFVELNKRIVIISIMYFILNLCEIVYIINHCIRNRRPRKHF